MSVSSVTTPLIGQNPDLLGQSMMRVLMYNEPLVDRLIQDQIDGVGLRMKRAYRYGRDSYLLGLPQGYSEYLNFDRAVVEAVLQQVEGEPVRIDDIELDFNNPAIHAARWMYENRGWDYFTDKITTPSQAMIDEANSNNTNAYNVMYNNFYRPWLTGITNNLPTQYQPATEYGVHPSGMLYKDTYWYTLETETAITKETTWNITTYGLEYDEINQATGVAIDYAGEYFFRQTASGILYKHVVRRLYAIDDTSYTTPLDTITFEPEHVSVHSFEKEFTWDLAHSEVGPLEFNRKDYYYGVLYTTASNARKAWTYRVEDGTYPSLNFTTSSSSSPFYPIVIFRRNNVDYFHSSRANTELYQTSKALLKKLKLDPLEIAAAINDNPDVGEIDHAYLIFATRLQTDNSAGIEYLARFFDRYAEEDEPLETVNATALFTLRKIFGGKTFRITEGGLDLTYSWTSVVSDLVEGRIGSVNTADRENLTNGVKFRWQVDEDTYKVISVYGLKLVNKIYQEHTVETTFEDSLSDENEFVIPLHYTIVDQMGAMKRNKLYYDSAQLIFNSYVLTKVKWYQTGFFKLILIAVTIYLVFTSPMFAKFTAALASGAYATAAIILIEALVISYLINIGFKYLVKALGIENSWIVALIAIVIAAYQLNAAGWNMQEAMWAENLLWVANGLSQGISANVTDLFKDLAQEVSLFNESVDKNLDALKEAQELLATDGLIDPFEFIHTEPMINFNESASDYYTRTVHNTNPGTQSFDMLTNYHDLMLQLPKPNFDLNGVV